MRISRRSQNFILKFVIFYFLLMAVILVNFYLNGNTSLILGEGKSLGNLDLFDILIYHVYKYALNFPLGFINWFSDTFLYITPVIAFINGTLLSFIIIRYFPENRGQVSKAFIIFSIVFSGYIIIKAIELLIDRLNNYFS